MTTHLLLEASICRALQKPNGSNFNHHLSLFPLTLTTNLQVFGEHFHFICKLTGVYLSTAEHVQYSYLRPTPTVAPLTLTDFLASQNYCHEQGSISNQVLLDPNTISLTHNYYKSFRDINFPAGFQLIFCDFKCVQWILTKTDVFIMIISSNSPPAIPQQMLRRAQHATR